MSDGGRSRAGGAAPRQRPDLMTKVVFPIAVAVIGALAITALTPAGEKVREWLFPTKAAVRGSVSVTGQAASDVELQLDGDGRGNPRGDGTFLIDDVGTGSHTLRVEVPGGEPFEREFRVESGDNEVLLGQLQLKPLYQLGYVLAQSGPSDVVRYTLTLWIIGDRSVMGAVKSVAYSMPAPLPTEEVKVRRGGEFCFSRSGEVRFEELVSGGGFSEARAVINLGDATVTLQNPRPNLPGFNRPPSSCPIDEHVPNETPPSTPPSPPPPTTSPIPRLPTPTGGAILRTVPGVVGAKYEAAVLRLRGNGFAVARTDVPAGESVGTVISQHPAKNTRARMGSTVILSVSKGHQQTRVPVVTDFAEADARAMLERSGFEAKTVDQDTPDPEEDGIVRRQDPPGGATATARSVVVIYVGRFRP